MIRSSEISTAELTRYRVMAYITGVLLVVLVLVAMPLKYLGDNDLLVRIIGPVHGWMYFFYLITALTLAYKLRWSVVRALLVALAGTVPFASFVAERSVVRDVSDRGRGHEAALGSTT